MTAFTCFAQFIHGTASHHFLAVTDKRSNDVFQVHQFWLAVVEADHIDTERVFQLRIQEQVIDDDFGVLTTFQVNRNAHTVFIGLVT